MSRPAESASRAAAARCLNCDAVLVGPFCAACGQRAERSLALGALLHDAVESLSHADSRLWRTLRLLLVRPGQLTREFLAGRRTRYVPPIRLYLIVSAAYFLVAALLPTGNVVPGVAIHGSAGGTAADAAKQGAAGSAPQASSTCDEILWTGPGESWVGPRLDRICRAITSNRADALIEATQHNVPRALFVFLPLFAAFMALLYWRPRRLYAEHLVFLLHSHAFAFLVLGAGTLAMHWLSAGARTALGYFELTWLATYFFLAMRRVYAQRPRRTVAKLLALGGAYVVAGLFTLALTVLFSA